MKLTLDEMCSSLKRLMRTTPDEKDAQILEAIWVRLSMEKVRRQKANREKRMETIFRKANKSAHQMFRSIRLKVGSTQE